MLKSNIIKSNQINYKLILSPEIHRSNDLNEKAISIVYDENQAHGFEQTHC